MPNNEKPAWIAELMDFEKKHNLKVIAFSKEDAEQMSDRVLTQSEWETVMNDVSIEGFCDDLTHCVREVVRERPDRPCDPDCSRRANPTSECDCSRSDETIYTGPTEPGSLTMDEVGALRAGDQVHWIDPDGGKCSRTVRLASAPVEISDGVVRLNEWGSGDFEVFVHELA